MRENVKKDNATRIKLLKCAGEEFMEKGYAKASLRNICKKAGMTTGALYFFFQDKEDLFENLTRETVELLYQMMNLHFQNECELAESGKLNDGGLQGQQHDVEDTRSIIEQMYLHREELLLILTKSQGSGLEHMEERFVSAAEQHYRKLANVMEKDYPDVRLDDKLIHWMAHMQIDAFIYMITHIEKKEEAYKYMTQAVLYMTKGWYGMYENKD